MKRRDAFTLIELLVVIAIIALLVSILMPSLQKAKEMAKDIVCMSNQRNVGVAIFLYCQDYDDMLPYTRGYTTDMDGDGKPELEHGWQKRVGAVPDDQISGHIRGTPREPFWRRGYIEFEAASDKKTEGHFKCPSAYDQIHPKGGSGWWSSNFSINRALCKHFSWNQELAGDVDCMRISDVRGKAVLIGDATLGVGSLIFCNTSYSCRSDGKYTDWFLECFGPWPWQAWGNAWGSAIPIDFYGHTGERSNLTFTDGHVEAVKDLKPADFNID
jgi:prepilin-type N-terminal cleavage/methylation domain-containing protein/prepilin-type processing-associated H-X9-DG protein